jgi:hypothetical protein
VTHRRETFNDGSTPHMGTGLTSAGECSEAVPKASVRYVAERLAGIDHIQNYDLSIRTQRLKQAASLIAHGRLIHPGHA